MTKRQLYAIKFLRFAENVFLRIHGWRSLPTESIHGKYVPPKDFPCKQRYDSYVRVHAVNAQRQVYAKETKDLTHE